MKIPSKDVIQADTPERVMGTIDAIARGAHDDKAIAAAIGGLDARQGRYYRRELWRTLPSGVSSDSSRLPRICLARSKTSFGTPASRATWMP